MTSPLPLLLAACFFLPLSAPGQEKAGERPPPPAAEPPNREIPPEPPPQPWIGCHLVRPDPAVAAQIPGLPPGVGLLVHSIAPDSPAAAADLRVNDIIWKFRDQWLVNQAQLAVLLRNEEIGGEIPLDVFRGGKAIQLKATLGTAPEPRKDDFFFDHGGPPPGPSIIVSKSRGERSASVRTGLGTAVMTRQNDGYLLRLRDPDGKEVFNRELPESGRWMDIPPGWRRPVFALRRSLDNSEETELTPVRPPRQRVVQPDSQPDTEHPPRPRPSEH